jgi:2',3'-cyclic-nucleotide 2'-phosphodiesterase (5'-nucleotidase family)
VLVLDSGNALFKSPAPGGLAREKARAVLLLEQMEALGTAAMAVGARDLSLGTDFLAQTVKGKKLKLLSANLVDAEGKPLFAASTVVTVGGVKFGVVGVSPSGPVSTAKGVKGLPPTKAALSEARRLREQEKVDVVVLLAALPEDELQPLSVQVGTTVDFLLQSHEGHAFLPRRNDFAVLLGAGDRGRQVARLELSLDGKGPFQDLSSAERAQQGIKLVEENLQQARRSLAAAKDETVRASWRETITSLEKRVQQLTLEAKLVGKAGERTFRFSYLQLGSDVVDDPELKRRVERIEPPGSASH